MSGLAGAVAFLTRLPMGRAATETTPSRTVPFVPLVGALIGLGVAGTYVGVVSTLPRLAAAVTAVTAGVLLTGALHEDGLADAADALGARDRSDVLRILRDPNHGTYGVLALIASFGLRASAIASYDRATALAVLPIAHAVSRVAAVAAVAAGPPLASDGLGASYAPAVRGRPLALSMGVAATGTVAVLQLHAIPVLVIGLVLAGATRKLALGKLGGVNGDVGGACQQVVETGLLVFLAH